MPGFSRSPAGVAIAAAVIVTGCGPGAGSPVGTASLRVTDQFGVKAIGAPSSRSAPGSETAMRQLQREHSVETRYGGRYVQTIDGLSGGTIGGRPVDWFFFVNGIESPVGAADGPLHKGDAVWWDRRDWGEATHVPAVVGSWPQPFKSGIGGKRIPVSIICPKGFEAQCTRAEKVLAQQGVSTARGLPGVGGRGAGIRVLVGDWRAVRNDRAAVLVGSGPQLSGVYARPTKDGATIQVLDEKGKVVDVLGPASGMVAATADADSPPTWIITGTDTTGVERALGALTARDLTGRYAVVTPADGAPYGVPRVK